MHTAIRTPIFAARAASAEAIRASAPVLASPGRREAAIAMAASLLRVQATGGAAYFSVTSTLVMRMSCVGTLFSPRELVATGLVAILSSVSRLFESVTWPKIV